MGDEINNKEKKDKEIQREEFLRQFAKAMKSMPLENVIIKQTPKMTNYTKEQVKRFLSNPHSYAENIRQVVDNLLISYPQFSVLTDYLPNMALFNYLVIPNLDKLDVNKDKMLKDYVKVCKYLENMNIKHEFKKALKHNFRYDTFFGYEIETDNSYFIIPLKQKYCRISGNEDGVHLVEFDFSYFKSNEKLVMGDELGRVAYPEEFKRKYLIYKQKGKSYQWQQLDCAIATKYNEANLDYPIPPFIGLFENLIDIEEYQALARSKAETDIYKLLNMEVPLKKDATEEDDFALSMDTILLFNQMVQEQLPQGVGVSVSPMKTTEISFNKSATSDRNNVQDSIDLLFDKSGFCKLAFSGSSSATALSYSVKVDEQRLFDLYRQYERILNRKIKNKFNGKFTVKILDMSKFSERDIQDQFLKTSQASAPTKTMLTASLGLEPLQVLGLQALENDVLNISEVWKPLQSSYTQSGDDLGGRPMKDDDELSDSGIQTREVDGNKNEKGGA